MIDTELLAVYDGADYELRRSDTEDVVYRVAHATGAETRWCVSADWPAARERLEAAARQRRVALTATRPAPAPTEPVPVPAPQGSPADKRTARKRRTLTAIERLKAAD